MLPLTPPLVFFVNCRYYMLPFAARKNLPSPVPHCAQRLAGRPDMRSSLGLQVAFTCHFHRAKVRAGVVTCQPSTAITPLVRVHMPLPLPPPFTFLLSIDIHVNLSRRSPLSCRSTLKTYKHSITDIIPHLRTFPSSSPFLDTFRGRLPCHIEHGIKPERWRSRAAAAESNH